MGLPISVHPFRNQTQARVNPTRGRGAPRMDDLASRAALLWVARLLGLFFIEMVLPGTVL